MERMYPLAFLQSFTRMVKGSVLSSPTDIYCLFMTQPDKAQRLLELHRGAEPLIVVNCWDGASAVVVEHAGFPAIASSSAGVANALGYADGQYVPWPEMVSAIRRTASEV